MRYFEWLFPIMRYVRRRREVSGAVMAIRLLFGLLLMVLVVATPAGIAYTGRSPAITSLPPLWLLQWIPAASVDAVIAAWDFVVAEWGMLLFAALKICLVLMAMNVVEFLLALFFVRKRPGRRRPRCTWQTLKYVMVGNVTLALFFVMLTASISFLMSSEVGNQFRDAAFNRLPAPWREPVGLSLIIIFFVGLPLVLLGAVSAQAASAVVVLQDDRRCEQCGYFLIHLTSPRCPECGRPFDPVKMGKLSLATMTADSNPEHSNNPDGSGG